MNCDNCEKNQAALFDSVDAGEPIGSELQGHLAGCEACRLYHQRLVRLRQSLTRDVPPLEALPAGLSARVMSAIEARSGRRRAVLLRLPRPVIAAAAACLLVAGAWVIFRGSSIDNGTGGGSNRPIIRKSASVSMPMTAPVEFSGMLLNGAVQLAGDPLAEEMALLVDDTRRFGGSLLANLPVELIPGVDRKWIESVLPAGSGAQSRPATTNPHEARNG